MNKNMKDFLKCQVAFGILVASVCTAIMVHAQTKTVVQPIMETDLPITIEPKPLIDSFVSEEIVNTVEVVAQEVKTVSVELPKAILKMDEAQMEFGVGIEEVEIVPEDVVIATYSVPNGEGVCKSYKKTWMDYRKITCKTSDQYALQQSEECYTDPVTGIRMVGDRYCIAMGTGYASEIGTKINLIMENGSVVKCILGDVKADCHTDETNRYQAFDGSVAEMIIDGEVFESTAQYPEELSGKILQVEIVE